ncbi:NAD(P)/FAD-dependent oxidoreductase [Georgenia sp. SYP-B2076]|uniref:NAD(P)/FAD-dependent oxidoreductase n=1 Tax=Georgenia sp. SYP-B2076 TaxID=2495881 RepID=UPI001F0CC166|nr:FAD-dependent oxidoreductase [Georgenia sp. SYP-B2076]
MPDLPIAATSGDRPALPRSVVVVGAGLAGLRTAAELRAQGFDGEVTVVGEESLAPYDRPPLSKELFTRTGPAWLADDGYGELGSLADRVLLGRRAARLDADDDGATLTLAPAGAAAAEELRADAVVLATGSHAVLPAGWSGAGVLHGAEDAARLRARLLAGARLVVVGAGWIGAEVVGLAAAHGCDVTVVEALPTPLYRQVGPEVGARTAPWYAEAGVDLRCGATVTEVREGVVVVATGADAGPLEESRGDGRVAPGWDAGRLSGGGVARDGGRLEELRADVVLAAVGVRPATGWLGGSMPLTPRGALRVDTGGRVMGAPSSVLAVGDCADMEVPGLGLVSGGHWDAALSHPAALVAGLLGGDVPAPAAPYVFSTQFGRELMFVGRPSPSARPVVRADGGEPWTVLFVEPSAGGDVGRLTAGFTVDRPRDVGALRRLLAAGARPVLDVGRARDVQVPLRKAVA